MIPMPNLKIIGKILEKHGPSILSWMAVGGTVLTGYLTHKASKKITMEVCAEAEKPENSIIPFGDLYKKTSKKYWKNYIPAGIAAAGTISCILGANYWHLFKEGGLAAAVTFYKASEEELYNAVKEKYGEETLEEIKTNIAKKRMEDDRPPWEPKDSNKMTIYDPYTKQWFRASQQDILWAELTANRMLQQLGFVTLNDILNCFDGVKEKAIGFAIGWSLYAEQFEEACYSPSGIAWITFCPKMDERADGSRYFCMDYEIHPDDLPIELTRKLH